MKRFLSVLVCLAVVAGLSFANGSKEAGGAAMGGKAKVIGYYKDAADVFYKDGFEVFKALAERFPDLHAATEGLVYQPSITFRSLKSLPVTWH